MFKKASTLIGASINDATHAQLIDAYINPDKGVKSWFYSEEGYQRIVDNFEADMDSRAANGIFFLAFASINTIAYDCLTKTINQAMGALIFSHREQVLRLIKDHYNFGSNRAAMLKAKGGFPVEIFKDFVISGDVTYSIKHLTSFLKS